MFAFCDEMGCECSQVVLKPCKFQRTLALPTRIFIPSPFSCTPSSKERICPDKMVFSGVMGKEEWIREMREAGKNLLRNYVQVHHKSLVEWEGKRRLEFSQGLWRANISAGAYGPFHCVRKIQVNIISVFGIIWGCIVDCDSTLELNRMVDST